MQLPTEWKYPIDPDVDYRLPENREYLVMAWVETLSYTTEMDQQLRLMNWAIERDHGGCIERKLWLAFLWGCCYNSIGPWTIMHYFPTPPEDMQKFADWYNEIFDKMRFDTDCRYRKSKMIACIQSYMDWLNGRTQAEAYAAIFNETDHVKQYEMIWETCMGWKYYGRLSAWNCVEAVALVTKWEHGIDCQSFMLDDRTGSESNRNGACFINDREDLLTKHGKLKSNGELIAINDCLMLEEKTESLCQRVMAEFNHIATHNRLNMETSLCCWPKKMFRARNTRYVGWDSERTYDELVYMAEHWPEVPLEPIYAAREHFLPDILRCETAPEGVFRGVDKRKMPVFFETGTPWHILKLQRGERWVIEEPKKKVTARRLF